MVIFSFDPLSEVSFALVHLLGRVMIFDEVIGLVRSWLTRNRLELVIGVVLAVVVIVCIE